MRATTGPRHTRATTLMALVICLALAGCTSIRDPRQVGGGGPGRGLATDSSAGANASGVPTAAPYGSVPGDGGELVTPDPNASIAVPDTVTVQLSDAPSARYAGFYAADVNGLYAQANLDLLIQPPAPGVEPVTLASKPDGPAFYVGPALAVLRARRSGASDLVNIAQLLQRSGERVARLAGTPLGRLGDLKGLRVTVLRGGYEQDLLAAVAVAGVDRREIHFTRGAFDPGLFAAGASDAAQVRLEDEYARILESVNPGTNALYQPADMRLLDISAPGLGALQDGIYARAAWLAEPGNADIATRFLVASLSGWIACREALDECAQKAVDAGADLPAQHQRWVLNEVNALIWPAPRGIGLLDSRAWSGTAAVALKAGLIDALPTAEATRSDLHQSALSALAGSDTRALGFSKAMVAITAGGQDPDPSINP